MKTEPQIYREKIDKLFNKTNSLAEKLGLDLKFLPEFCAMHVGAVINEKAKCQIDSKNMIFQYFSTMNDRIINKGMPADWAFTICNLMDYVHHYQKNSGKHFNAALIRNFVFQNYAYKLRGVKRVAFIANIFAGLHYDTESNPSESFFRNIEEQQRVDKIMKIGEYALQKFGFDDEAVLTEVGIYLAFISLFMADVEKQVRENWMKCSEYIKKANIKNGVKDQSLLGLWQFLCLYLKMIKDNHRMKEGLDYLQHSQVLLPECQGRWRKAIRATRRRMFPWSNSFVDTWLKRLDVAF